MLIYLASRFEQQKILIEKKAQIESLGHEVNSRWLTEETEKGWREKAKELAKKDFEDIDASDMFLVDMTCDLTGAKGGHFVELGYALKGKKIIWIIGKQPNVFCYHKNVRLFADWEEVYASLSKMILKGPKLQDIEPSPEEKAEYAEMEAWAERSKKSTAKLILGVPSKE